jgi:arylsulfatase
MKTTRKQNLLAVALACAVPLLDTAAPAHAANKKPNILFILVDNLGYGEIGCYGGGVTRGAPTPRIDSLAKSGLRLLNMSSVPAEPPSGDRPRFEFPMFVEICLTGKNFLGLGT